MTLRVHREGKEIPRETGSRVRAHFGIEEQSAEFLPGPEHFAPLWSAPPTVSGREIKERQGSREGVVEPRVLGRTVGPERALHLTADVRQLLAEREPFPAQLLFRVAGG